jgi:hypothetical protein
MGEIGEPRKADVAAAMKMKEFYRSRGWQSVPSRMDEKRPLVSFRDYWDRDFDFDPFDTSRWHVKKEPHPLVTTNLQLVLGRHRGLMAFDLDGAEAQRIFPTWGPLPRTWVSFNAEGGGQHWWFRIAKDYPKPLPAAFLWKGEGGHSGIERLCDKSLLMAPPSIHPADHSRRYAFLKGSRSGQHASRRRWSRTGCSEMPHARPGEARLRPPDRRVASVPSPRRRDATTGSTR